MHSACTKIRIYSVLVQMISLHYFQIIVWFKCIVCFIPLNRVINPLTRCSGSGYMQNVRLSLCVCVRVRVCVCVTHVHTGARDLLPIKHEIFLSIFLSHTHIQDLQPAKFNTFILWVTYFHTHTHTHTHTHKGCCMRDRSGVYS